jgi:hypothetical protein
MIRFELNYAYFVSKAMLMNSQALRTNVQQLIKSVTEEHNCHLEEYTDFNKWSIRYYCKCSDEDFIVFKLKHPDAIKYTEGRYSVTFYYSSSAV